MPADSDRKHFFAVLCPTIECGRSISPSDLAGGRPILSDAGFFEGHDRIRVGNQVLLGNELYSARET